tara:strand:+ start:155 stop:1855 length:1701 start_codon:yes stop_codon:yes gene_type:complete
MINYTISYDNPHRHYVKFKLRTKVISDYTHFQLSAWRPGRYELGNFAQNIQKWEAFNEYEKPLPFKKITKDLWQVKTSNCQEIIIKYNFYANQLDAGGCYLDENQLYLNPVHCMFYIVERINERYSINIELPENYRIASSLKETAQKLIATNYDDLAESPIICSPNLQYQNYKINNVVFHMWFQGKCKPNWKKLKKDFSAFSRTQINEFGGFPVDEYHFLFQITPYKSYHGVEHTKNTVILLGPGDKLMSDRYEDLLGVSSHELYHTWNIKAIRPKEMLPYDYTKENYFRTGFVAEGVTTYMGDLMLYKSKVFNWNEFIKTQNQNIERHLTNYGRYNLSVADSGFDNWLDGYKLGAPNRKVSIYPDAALCMLMIDLEILKNSKGKYSLNTVMKEMYNQFAIKKIGYSEKDFKNICIEYGGAEVSKIFKKHIYGTQDYIPSLKKSLAHIGLKMKNKKNPNLLAQYFGMIAVKENNKIIIKKIEPNSIADKCAIGPEDEIICINNIEVKKDINELLKDCGKEIIFKIKKKFTEKEVKMQTGKFYNLLEIIENKEAGKEQLKLRNKWST